MKNRYIIKQCKKDSDHIFKANTVGLCPICNSELQDILANRDLCQLPRSEFIIKDES